MITVLISVYFSERPDYLHQALESLVSQLAADDEVVVVEDGPLTLDLSDTLDSFRDRLPIRRIVSQENVGLAQALNLGLRYATQPWIVRFDSDDICFDDRIEIQKRVIQDGKYDFFGGQILEFDEVSGNVSGRRNVPLCEDEISSMLYKRNPFNHVTMCINRKLLMENCYPNIPGFEDYALWATLISKGYRYGNTDDVLVKVRAGGNMLSRRSGWGYVKREVKLRRYFISLSSFDTCKVVFFGFLRCVSFLFPVWVKSFYYKKYLRHAAV